MRTNIKDTVRIKEVMKNNERIDVWTLLAISIIVYILQNILHEFIGHGIATIIVGGNIISWSTAYLEHNLNEVGLFSNIVSAAGPLVNILVGLVFWIVLHTKKYTANSLDFFIWLSMTVNLLTGTGYFLFSGVGGLGDWNDIIITTNHYFIWRIVLIILGIATYLGTIWLSLNKLNSFIGSNIANRKKLSLQLTVIAYLSGSIVASAGAILNPISILYFFTSLASTFGGTSGLVWMSTLYSTKIFTPTQEREIQINRNPIWIISAIILMFLHIVFLGRSISFT